MSNLLKCPLQYTFVFSFTIIFFIIVLVLFIVVWQLVVLLVLNYLLLGWFLIQLALSARTLLIGNSWRD